jgi:alkylation response protein AidB-like acyl-CoA dehydrogenase
MSTIQSRADTTDPVGAARGLRELIMSHAAQSERQCHLDDPVVEALRDAGLFATLVPTDLGGLEADPVSAVEVVAEVSYADGSTGWTLMANMVTSALAGAFLGDEAVARIFADTPHVACAGQLAPKGVAVWEDGGWRVQGRFGFGSGSRHAEWMLGGFREVRDGEVERLENGLPSVLGVFVPRSGVRFLDNWDVMGLVATASHDYEIVDQQAPAPFAFPLFSAEPRRGGPLYRLGVHGLTAVSHAGFALGVARRALDELAALARTKRRLGQDLLVAGPTFQRDYAQAEATRRSAAAYVRHAFGSIFEAATADEITLEQRADIRMATTHATESAAAIVAFAYHAAGSDGLRNGNVIQRCFRDVNAGTQHLFVDEKTMVDAARVLLAQADAGLIL